MRAHRIVTERPVPPHPEYIKKMRKLLPFARKTYRLVQDTEAKENPDYDPMEFDPDVWLMSLQYASNKLDAPFTWNLAEEYQGKKPVNVYLHSAHTNDDGTISFNLYSPHMEDGLNYDIFVGVIERTLDHEAIHMTQRDRMGAERYATRTSGFQKGSEDFKSSDPEIQKRGMRTYLSDPQEISPHAKDLHSEAKSLDDPIMVLKQSKKNIKYLPTLQKYLAAGFHYQDSVVKRLLSLAAQYDKMYDN